MIQSPNESRSGYYPIAIALGMALGVVAIFFCIQDIQFNHFWAILQSLLPNFIILAAIINLLVIMIKALRWQIIVSPVKHIGYFIGLRMLIVGFMANNVLPFRLGEVARLHLLKKHLDLGYVTSTGTIITERLVEGLSFIFLIIISMFYTPYPLWMRHGLIMTIFLTLILFGVAKFYSGITFKNPLLTRLQHGFIGLGCWKITAKTFIISGASWLGQCLLLITIHQSFAVDLPVHSTFLILAAVNIAIAIPSTPAQIGAFELACVMIYQTFGIDQTTSLAMALVYHFVQLIPITTLGAIITLYESINPVPAIQGAKQ